MIARLVRSVDFERVLRTRSRISGPHFAIHHVPDRPSVVSKTMSDKLLTVSAPATHGPVDESLSVTATTLASGAIWFGAVVPKRHARRSVTRTVLKRQIRAVLSQNATWLAGGLWVIRLRNPFDRSRFVSAASDELRRAVRAELDGLIGSVARRMPAGA